MEEIARVIDIQENKAVLLVDPGEQCDSCHVCTHYAKPKMKTLTLPNLLNAQVDDKIVLEINESKSIQFSALVYIFPLLMLILGYFFGMYLLGIESDNNPLAVIFPLFFLGVSFLIIKWIDNKSHFTSRYSPKMSRFYKPGESLENRME